MCLLYVGKAEIPASIQNTPVSCWKQKNVGDRLEPSNHFMVSAQTCIHLYTHSNSIDQSKIWVQSFVNDNETEDRFFPWRHCKVVPMDGNRQSPYI